MQQIESPIKTLLALPASMAPSISIITRDKQNMFQLLRPAANDRTRMGWHKRHASVSDRGSRGILRPETLNLEAWISCSGIFQKNPKMNKRANTKERSLLTATNGGHSGIRQQRNTCTSTHNKHPIKRVNQTPLDEIRYTGFSLPLVSDALHGSSLVAKGTGQRECGAIARTL